MIFSLVRVLFFVGLVVLLALLAGQLLEAEGSVRIAAFDTEVTLGPLQAVIAALVVFLALWLLLKLAGLLVALVRFVSGDETALTRHFGRRRQHKGFEALSDGILALAAGEGQVALTKASKAERFLKRPELTDVLTAQAAEMTGDRKKAGEVYRRLVTHDKTRFIGVRGLMRQKLAEGDTDTAMKLAEKAFAIKPRHEETQDTLLRLQAEHHDWAGARKTLGAKLRHGAMPRDLHRRRDAVLALSEARDVFDEGKSIEARESAIEANRLSPDLVPAAVMAARAYMAQTKPRHAARVLRKAWGAQPHPDIAAAYAEIAPEETPAARIKRFQALQKIHPDHAESRLMMSELHIAAEDFPAARRALGDLPSKDPTTRVLTNMAAIERGEGADDHVVRAWLAKAVTARRGPHWTCDKCHHIHAAWAPVCENCHAFDTLAWREPPAGDVALPAGAEMMPLLVGSRPETTVVATTPVPRATPEATPETALATTEAPAAPAPEPSAEAASVPDAEIVPEEVAQPVEGDPARREPAPRND